MRLPFLVGLSAAGPGAPSGRQERHREEFLSAFKEESTAVLALTEGVARAEAARRRAGAAVESQRRLLAGAARREPASHQLDAQLDATPGRTLRPRQGERRRRPGRCARAARPRTGRACGVRFARLSPRGALPSRGAKRSRQQLERVHSARRDRAAAGARGRGVGPLGAAVHAGGGRGSRDAWALRKRRAPEPKPWRAPGGRTSSPQRSPLRSAPPEPPVPTDPADSPRTACPHARGGAGGTRARNVRAASSRSRRCNSAGSSLPTRVSARSGPIFAASWTIPLFDRDQRRADRGRAPPAGRGGARRAGTRARGCGNRRRSVRVPPALRRVPRGGSHV